MHMNCPGADFQVKQIFYLLTYLFAMSESGTTQPDAKYTKDMR